MLLPNLLYLWAGVLVCQGWLFSDLYFFVGVSVTTMHQCSDLQTGLNGTLNVTMSYIQFTDDGFT